MPTITDATLLASKQFLIVNESAAVTESVATVLRANGADTESATNFDEAIRKLTRGRKTWSAVVCDYDLGQGQTGIELINVARQYYDEHLPAMLYTTRTDAYARQQALQRSIPMITDTPHDPQALVEAIVAVIWMGPDFKVNANQAAGQPSNAVTNH